MTDDLVKRARRLDTCIFPTERSKCLCGELADYIEKLEEQAHYANGVADLAMKHRDYAEQRVEKLEAALRDVIDNYFDSTRICEIAHQALEK